MPIRPLPTAASRRPRADAARNREAILLAAQRLFAQHAPEDVSMDAIADAACVGKPTLYRRFGDRAGLVRAVLEARETAFQEAVLRGPPPLGPGAPPAERLTAFLTAYIDHVRESLPVMVAAEAAVKRRHVSLLYESYRQHIALLVGEALPDDPNADYLVDALLQPMSAELYAAQRGRGMTHEQIQAGVRALVERVLGT